jgi:hypothetical protein
MANERAHIAQVAAQLIVESGIDDWQFARRKALKSLGLPDRTPLPDRAELEAALRDYAATYLADEQPELLADLRDEALSWMEMLTEFEPELTGPAAEGWAYPGAEIRIELLADDAKLVEIALLNRNVPVDHAPARSPQSPTILESEGDSGPVRLIVQDVRDRRNRKQDRVRIRAAELRQLVEGDS